MVKCFVQKQKYCVPTSTLGLKQLRGLLVFSGKAVWGKNNSTQSMYVLFIREDSVKRRLNSMENVYVYVTMKKDIHSSTVLKLLIICGITF